MYKAKQRFSFGGKVYEEGQEITETNKVALAKLESQGFISSGKGKSADEVAQEQSDEQEKEGEENAQIHADAAEAERLRVVEAGRNSINFKAPIDQTKSTKTVSDTAAQEKVEVPAKKSAPKKAAKK